MFGLGVVVCRSLFSQRVSEGNGGKMDPGDGCVVWHRWCLQRLAWVVPTVSGLAVVVRQSLFSQHV
jgi:hypothetical protein